LRHPARNPCRKSSPPRSAERRRRVGPGRPEGSLRRTPGEVWRDNFVLYLRTEDSSASSKSGGWDTPGVATGITTNRASVKRAEMLPVLAAIVLAILPTAPSERAAPIGGGRCAKMHARLDRLRTETALLEARIRDSCELQPSNEMLPFKPADMLVSGKGALGARELSHFQANSAAPSESASVKMYNGGRSSSVPADGSRRRGERDLRNTYSVQCYGAGSSFTSEPSCGCLGKPKSSEFDLRPTIKIVVGSW
jgi:hypothetical protein